MIQENPIKGALIVVLTFTSSKEVSVAEQNTLSDSLNEDLRRLLSPIENIFFGELLWVEN